ncbi:hypothetical protein ACFC26_41310 [Kitasatospora purpeofusca]|uniref:hypothetical protein n=1 Tax=Kitasatospora purpeofusca TaxID=67352 RepID=UPI0035D809D1
MTRPIRGLLAVLRRGRRARLAAEQALAAAEQGIRHRRLQIEAAADMAITFTPADPANGHRVITVARVQELAAEHFGLQADVEEAAAALAGRLHYRGWLGIRTDLLDPEFPADGIRPGDEPG